MGRTSLKDDEVTSFRQKVCDTALRLFVEEGREGVTLRSLARALGVSHTTPYRYFDSVEEIFSAVRIRCFSRFEGYLRERLEPLDDAMEALRVLGKVYFQFACEHRCEFEIMLAMDQPDPARYPDSIEAGRRAWSVPYELCRRAVEEGRVDADSESLAHLLWSGTHGITVLHLAGKYTLGRSAEELLTLHTNAILGEARP